MSKEIVSIWADALCVKHHVPCMEFMAPKDVYVELQDIKGTIANEEVFLKGGSEFAEENLVNLEAYRAFLEDFLPEGYTLEREQSPFRRYAKRLTILFFLVSMVVFYVWEFFIRNIAELDIQYTWSFLGYALICFLLLGLGFFIFLSVAELIDTAKEIKEDRKTKKHGK